MEHQIHRRLMIGVAVMAILVVAGILYISGVGQTGTAQFMVHDAPCSQCTHVWVTFTTVSVQESGVTGSSWINVNVSGSTVDLQELNGSAAAKVLGIGTLPAGHYQQIRVEVSKVVISLLGGSQLSATILGPSQDFNGQFTVKAGATTVLNIDIDLSASLHITPGPNGSESATFTPDIATVDASGP